MSKIIRLAKNFLARQHAAKEARNADAVLAITYTPTGGLNAFISMHGVPDMRETFEDMAGVCFHNLTRLESEGDDE